MCQVCAAVLVMGASQVSLAVGRHQRWSENPNLSFYIRCRNFSNANEAPGQWQLRRESEQWPGEWRNSFDLSKDMEELGIHEKWSNLIDDHRKRIEQWIAGEISQYEMIPYRGWFGR